MKSRLLHLTSHRHSRDRSCLGVGQFRSRGRRHHRYHRHLKNHLYTPRIRLSLLPINSICQSGAHFATPLMRWVPRSLGPCSVALSIAGGYITRGSWTRSWAAPLRGHRRRRHHCHSKRPACNPSTPTAKYHGCFGRYFSHRPKSIYHWPRRLTSYTGTKYCCCARLYRSRSRTSTHCIYWHSGSRTRSTHSSRA